MQFRRTGGRIFFLWSREKVRGCAVDPATESDGSEGFSDLCSGSLLRISPPSSVSPRPSFVRSFVLGYCWAIFFAWEDGTLLGRAAGLTHAPPPFNPALFSIWAGKSVIKKRSRLGLERERKRRNERVLLTSPGPAGQKSCYVLAARRPIAASLSLLFDTHALFQSNLAARTGAPSKEPGIPRSAKGGEGRKG